MKRILIIFSVCIFSTSFSFAQNKNDLKGPKAKNYKPWANNSKKQDLTFIESKSRLVGPNAKNQKPWDNLQNREDYMVVNTSNLQRAKGPKAKNRKPWDANQSSREAYVQSNPEIPLKKEKEGDDRVELNNKK